MATLMKNRRKIKLDSKDNKKIIEELKAAPSSIITSEYKSYLNSCLEVVANVSKNKTHRLF
ncbi:hypothetical protein [Bacillus alveayuensis]|uniref:hypothetical protein n=1 Tax=Aeribacillus alveayuensis TaxID=279215 RepID=UPI0005CD701A|nr:hypothetical protein [Bacillus alveayuensis]